MESEIGLLRKNISRLVSDEIKPEVKEWEKGGRLPSEILARLSEIGLFGLTIPEEHGGIGYGAEVLVAALDELARGSASLALFLLFQNSLVGEMLTLAKEEDLIAALIEGKSFGGGAIFPEGLKEEGGLSGEGSFLINGAGDFFVLVGKEKSYLIDTIESTPVATLAFRDLQISSFVVRDVPVRFSTSTDRIKDAIDLYLLGLSAIALGIGREILSEAKTYAQNRKQFGRPIIEFWMVQDMLVEIATTVKTSELLVKETASRYDKKDYDPTDIAITKSFVTNRIMTAATHGVQIFGGYGYTTDYPMERYFREAKALEVMGIVNEELRSQIAQSL
ncbi:hypothetical protein DRP53_01885 [candidate division WOR-3 bacterium]|mgnify:CR=1 FL=1|uniref:Acyl-CoA dehydrogenase n=1 Tax=candidate division WOR-3 bacterium TaxID=2052148 RepID=A0A660SMU5_UNCW3|nr:MAG: hypothetical protein DRP53_01885 [candidate division WOR-3 bacterium]